MQYEHHPGRVQRQKLKHNSLIIPQFLPDFPQRCCHPPSPSSCHKFRKLLLCRMPIPRTSQMLYFPCLSPDSRPHIGKIPFRQLLTHSWLVSCTIRNSLEWNPLIQCKSVQLDQKSVSVCIELLKTGSYAHIHIHTIFFTLLLNRHHKRVSTMLKHSLGILFTLLLQRNPFLVNLFYYYKQITLLGVKL